MKIIFELNVHSDLRSDKIDQIEKNNKVSCLFYDDKKNSNKNQWNSKIRKIL